MTSKEKIALTIAWIIVTIFEFRYFCTGIEMIINGYGSVGLCFIGLSLLLVSGKLFVKYGVIPMITGEKA